MEENGLGMPNFNFEIIVTPFRLCSYLLDGRNFSFMRFGIVASRVVCLVPYWPVPRCGYLSLYLSLCFGPNMAKWGSTCNRNYLYRWLPCQNFILLMMGAWRPKHVEKVCSNKICILLHHVGVLFNLITGTVTERRNYQLKRDAASCCTSST